MVEMTRLLILPEGGSEGLTRLGRLLFNLRRRRGWSIDDVIEHMAVAKPIAEGLEAPQRPPHPGSLRGVESGARAPSRELVASWLTALGWDVRVTDHANGDRLIATDPNGRAVELLFGIAARSARLFEGFERAIERGTSGNIVSIDMPPAGTGAISAALLALLQLHDQDAARPVRAVWIAPSRAQARQIMDKARQIDRHAQAGQTGIVTSLKKVILGNSVRNWAVAVGITPDMRGYLGTSEWSNAIPREGTLLVIEDAHRMVQDPISGVLQEQLVAAVQGVVLLTQTPRGTGLRVRDRSTDERRQNGLVEDATGPKGEPAQGIRRRTDQVQIRRRLESLDPEQIRKVARYMAGLLNDHDRLLVRGFIAALDAEQN